MKARITHHYEVVGWNKDQPTIEAYHSNCTTKREAMRVGAWASSRYDKVEVSKVAVAADDPENYIAAEVLKTYERDGRS